MKALVSLLGIGLLLGSCGGSSPARAGAITEGDYEPVIGRRFVSPLVPMRVEIGEEWELPVHAVALQGGRMVLHRDLESPAKSLEVVVTWGPGGSRPVNPDFLESSKYPFSLERYLEVHGDQQRKSDPYRTLTREGATTILGSPAYFFEISWKRMPARTWKLFVHSPANLVQLDVSVPEESDLTLEQVSSALDDVLAWDTSGIWWSLPDADEDHHHLVHELIEEGEDGLGVKESVYKRILELEEEGAALVAWGISSTHDRLKLQYEAELRADLDPVEAAMRVSPTEARLVALADLAADLGDLRLMVPLIFVAQEEGLIVSLGRFGAWSEAPPLAQPFR